jgi:hypothetical protein
VRSILRRLAERANLEPGPLERVSGHSLRVGMAQDLIASGADLPGVMQVGRWRTPAVPALERQKLLAVRGRCRGAVLEAVRRLGLVPDPCRNAEEPDHPEGAASAQDPLLPVPTRKIPLLARTPPARRCGQRERHAEYEPYVHVLSNFLLMPLPGWLPQQTETATRHIVT